MAKKSCKEHCHRFIGFWKRYLPVIFLQIIGWAALLYLEEDIIPTDCFVNLDKVAEKAYKPSNETQNAINFHIQLLEKYHTNASANGTHANASAIYITPELYGILYAEFKQYFGVKPVTDIGKHLTVLNTCLKWFRFTLVTLTTVGYGNDTPKTPQGKLFVIFYALIGIPLMLILLNYTGKMVQDLTNWIIKHCCRSGEDDKNKNLKTFIILFVLLSILIISGASEAKNHSKMRLPWIDGIYFYFVTYSTIGYGDITSPLYYTSMGFGGSRILFGLALVSAIIDLSIKFMEGSKNQKTINETAEDAENKEIAKEDENRFVLQSQKSSFGILNSGQNLSALELVEKSL